MHFNRIKANPIRTNKINRILADSIRSNPITTLLKPIQSNQIKSILNKSNPTEPNLCMGGLSAGENDE